LTETSQESEIAGAIGYALARRDALMRFCDDGKIERDFSQIP
jgi:hypothetical protein